MDTKEFIEKAKKVHNNKYDYSLVKYKNSTTKIKIKIICPIHGIFMQPPITHYKSGCQCYSSHGEEKILNYLNNKDLKFFKEYKFDDLFDKRRLSFDFYLHKIGKKDATLKGGYMNCRKLYLQL